MNINFGENCPNRVKNFFGSFQSKENELFAFALIEGFNQGKSKKFVFNLKLRKKTVASSFKKKTGAFPVNVVDHNVTGCNYSGITH